MAAKKCDGRPPRYLDYRQSQLLREAIDRAVLTVKRELADDGADPRCFDAEIALALARAAVRCGVDLIDGADKTIERLEAVVAELGAKFEQGKIEREVYGYQHNGKGNGGTHPDEVPRHVPGCRCEVCS